MRITFLVVGILSVAIMVGCESEEERNKRQVAACGKNLQCLSSLGMVTAEVFCKTPIERLSPYDMKWDDIHYGERFSKIAWKDMEHGIITYIGDRAKFQTPTGAYINVVYSCDIDITDTNNPVRGVQLVRLGKL